MTYPVLSFGNEALDLVDPADADVAVEAKELLEELQKLLPLRDNFECLLSHSHHCESLGGPSSLVASALEVGAAVDL